MQPFRRALVPLALLVAVLLAPSSRSQPLALDVHGGGLGETLTLTLTGPPNAFHLLIASTTTGPTPWPGQPVGSIDVGFDLIAQSLAAPGFLGFLDGAGSHVIALPVPADGLLDDLNLNFQAVRIDTNKVVEKSNLWRVTFDWPGETALALGELATARAFAAVASLADGTVLVAGGGAGDLTSATGLKSVELYRPNLEAFEPLPDMNSARSLHRATRLLDGRVLVTGGVDGAGNPLASAEIFDPATGLFAATGSLSIARVGHTQTLLPDGHVLVAGGSNVFGDAVGFATSAQKSTEIFDPAGAGSFSAGPNMAEPKTFHDAVALLNGKVLMSGGITFITIIVPIPSISDKGQLYTPSAGAGSFGASQSMGSARAAHASILLADGRVLLVGGASGSLLSPVVLASCELYKEGSGFAAAGAMSSARAIASLVRLPDGQVLAAGGAQGDLTNPVSVAALERYAPAPPAGAGSWTTLAPLHVSRSGQGGVLLADGTAAFIGGGGGPTGTALKSAEIHQP